MRLICFCEFYVIHIASEVASVLFFRNDAPKILTNYNKNYYMNEIFVWKDFKLKLTHVNSKGLSYKDNFYRYCSIEIGARFFHIFLVVPPFSPVSFTSLIYEIHSENGLEPMENSFRDLDIRIWVGIEVESYM